MQIFISFLVGFIFSFGLALGGMTNTNEVRGFLDLFGNWNLNLMAVMVGAISVHSLAYLIIKNKKSPLLDSKFYIPTNKIVDKKLIIGATIFGLGWGWAGICPGPAIVSLGSGKSEIIVFLIAMILGMYCFKFISKKFNL